LTSILALADTDHPEKYYQHLAAFKQSLLPVQAKIGELRGRLEGTPVTASEPVFGYVFDALGMKVRDQSFQLSVMNNTEPSASDIAAMENDLRTHHVRLFVYNSQASDPMAVRMENIARAAGVPVLGVTETEPAGTRYQDWMLGELDSIDKALPH
jgi:zinc/manganese transport system substrate-binding protein